MTEIKLDKRNYRIHSDKNKKLIAKSLDECGAGRSIVVDNEGEIIGGNGIYEAWGDKPIKVVETDGTELVVVKRTDLATDDEKRKRLAIMDNSTSDSSEFDLELLNVDFDVPDLKDMGIDVPEIKENEPKDISENLKEIWQVVVECHDEIEQQEIFEKLSAEGLECRLLTL